MSDETTLGKMADNPKQDKMLNSDKMIHTKPKEVPTESSKEETKKNEEKDHTNALNDGIYGLKYNELEVLAKNGETVENFVPKEGKKKADKFIVVERKKKDINTTPVDISIIDSVTDRTYPGALQLTNKNFTENKPDALITKRKPQTIHIDLPGMGDAATAEVENPTYANVSTTIDKLVNKWHDNHSGGNSLPARTQYSETMVYSKSQVEAALNVNSKILDGTLGVDFKSISKGEKKVMIAAYKQIFYTVSATLPNNPAAVFDKSVSFDELVKKGVSNSAPPLFVSNVAYGRTVFVKLETSSKSLDVEAAFSAALKGTDVKKTGKYSDILENSSFTALVLGGDAAEHNKVVTKDFNVIRNVIKDNATFSRINPAYPISYTSTFLKNNKIAGVNNRSEYVETTTTEYNSGKMKLINKGGFVAQFRVQWDEVDYDAAGKEILTKKSWDGNYQDRTSPFSTVIPLPANARNIKVFARECTGLAWEWWRTVLDDQNVKLAKEIEVSLWGTTLSPGGSIEYKN
ncbi:streptolysin O [Streptococcus urinalis FB127-CNA-2]|uniref:Thiol-activated cytolysin n=2 Tax=Streptococcus urinalis TaxID=149016 RepID=G5KD05_9STRE|nr:thiol-activated cytolysin family protein [Streptococcus urinalis]EHJ57796.1 perfringolysin O [Streptococcus urinalis 2285-97]EKS17074.1 streptolysin O [Streptococcus urinalis FB127-CNA-2]VEF32676.1 streptolysin O [Streptococcus urinalis]